MSKRYRIDLLPPRSPREVEADRYELELGAVRFFAGEAEVLVLNPTLVERVVEVDSKAVIYPPPSEAEDLEKVNAQRVERQTFETAQELAREGRHADEVKKLEKEVASGETRTDHPKSRERAGLKETRRGDVRRADDVDELGKEKPATAAATKGRSGQNK